MKNLFALFLILPGLFLTGQTINQGDHLKTEYKKISKPYFFNGPNFTPWVEGAGILLIGAKPKATDCNFLFLALKDTTLIGVFKMSNPPAFIFDTEGNSIMNSTSQTFVLPAWVVKKRTKVSSSDKTVFSLLDKLYEKTLQANDLELDEKTVAEYQRYQTDTSLANRHIAVLFDNYQTIITESAEKGQRPPADICIPLMRTLESECVALFNKVHIMVSVYMGEALESGGMIEEARKHFKKSLEVHPTSIPIQVYNYKLEPDSNKKKEQLTALKKKYPQHWMVKDL